MFGLFYNFCQLLGQELVPRRPGAQYFNSTCASSPLIIPRLVHCCPRGEAGGAQRAAAGADQEEPGGSEQHNADTKKLECLLIYLFNIFY